jgi:hypothetical protein
MPKQTYWIVGGEADTHALITGAAERDDYLHTGDWTAADEPADNDWVYIWHEGAEVPGRYPASSLRDLWGPRGYVAGPPPGGIHPLAPAERADVPEQPADAPAETKPSKPAARGDANKE